jgi:hypothetical protein
MFRSSPASRYVRRNSRLRTSVLGSERLTGALLDRLTHHVHILEMNCESYRLASSKKRQRMNAKQNGHGEKVEPEPKNTDATS